VTSAWLEFDVVVVDDLKCELSCRLLGRHSIFRISTLECGPLGLTLNSYLPASRVSSPTGHHLPSGSTSGMGPPQKSDRRPL